MTQNTKGRQNTSEKKVKKGDFGYFQSEKKRKLIIAFIKMLLSQEDLD